MSRRLLLATGGPAAEIPDPVDPTDPEPNPGWPTTDDVRTLALRPAGRAVATYRVGGVGSTHSTLAGASDAGQAAALAAGKQTAIAWPGNPGPDYRFDVLAASGTHAETTGWGAWANLVGLGVNSAATVVQSASNAAGGVLHTFGSAHVENITVRALASGGLSPRYCLHITGGEQVTCTDVHFDASAAAFGGSSEHAGTVGMDGLAGAGITFYRCQFTNAPGGPSMNLHGSTPGPDPIRVAFIDCDADGTIGFGGPGTADGDPDELYVIGCTGVTEIAANATTHVFTDDPTVTVTGGGPVTRGVITWPQPDDGLSDTWRDYFLPSSIGDEPYAFTPTAGTLAPMTPVAGRTYITRVRPPVAMHATSARHTAAAAGGLYGIHINPADSDTPAGVQPPLDYTAVAGANTLAHYYFHTRYPGDDGFWIYHRFGTGSSVQASTTLAGVTDCFYTDNGSTLVPVANGTAHPVPTLIAAS